MFVTISLIFSGKSRSLPDPLQKALALPIRQGWKILTVTNPLAYYDTDGITTVKNFVHAPERKSSNAIIYFI